MEIRKENARDSEMKEKKKKKDEKDVIKENVGLNPFRNISPIRQGLRSLIRIPVAEDEIPRRGFCMATNRHFMQSA